MEKEKTKESLFQKIVSMLKMLFKKDSVKLLAAKEEDVSKPKVYDMVPTEVEEIKEEEKTLTDELKNYTKNIEIEDNERFRLLKLQESFRNGEISESDILEEDVLKIAKIYDEQILELKLKIDRFKKKLKKTS